MAAAEPADRTAIVIGSGIGGLTCAAYLAVTGHRVLVLEQAAVLGGNSHVFRRNAAYEFDAGVHYLGDCGQDGVLPAILRGLAVADRVRFRALDPDGFDEIVLPGLRMRMPVGWDRYLDRLTETMPTEQQALREFVRIASAVAGEMRWTLLSSVDVEPAEILRRTPNAMRWARHTLTELFEHCGLSARARTVLAAQALNYGIGPAEATVGMHASVTDHYLRGAAYPVGGGQTLAATLTEVITAHGGTVLTRRRVERIVVDEGRAVGVLLADGQRLDASVVVSNADYPRTVIELAGERHFPKSIGNRARAAIMGFPLVVLYVGLDTELPGRPNANVWWHDNDDIDAAFDRLARDEFDVPPSVFISFASAKDPDTPPSAHQGTPTSRSWRCAHGRGSAGASPVIPPAIATTRCTRRKTTRHRGHAGRGRACPRPLPRPHHPPRTGHPAHPAPLHPIDRWIAVRPGPLGRHGRSAGHPHQPARPLRRRAEHPVRQRHHRRRGQRDRLRGTDSRPLAAARGVFRRGTG